MSNELYNKIREAEASLRQGDAKAARLHLSRARSMASRAQRTTTALQGDVDRYQLLMERTLKVTLADGLEPIAEQILDGMLAIVDAQRGFVGLIGDDNRWTFLAARSVAQSDIDDPSAQISRSIIAQAIGSREPVITHDAAGQEFSDQASVHQLQLRSVVCLPLVEDQKVFGFVYLDDPNKQGVFDDAALTAVQSWLPVVNGAVVRARAAAKQAPTEGLNGVVTRSDALTEQLTELARIARFEVSILLTGETGTGKSLIARRLHEASDRSARPFVHVNCGAIPESLIESELFGHKKGAFTGAMADKPGKFEVAEGGTIFLDELDSMPLSCQVRLLVVLQERVVTRLGGNKATPIDVRVIAAMGTDPSDAIDEGRLREDLYYRLAVFVTHIPPLRQRMQDVPLLASHFLEDTRKRYRLPPIRLSETALDALLRHDWPGNVRELRNTLDRAALLARDGVIEDVSFQGRRRASGSEDSPSGLIERIERTAQHFVQILSEREALRSFETADV
ncbi:MAG: sigma 54-interacting transcriptional regulator, partial [Myxococcota bacterium]